MVLLRTAAKKGGGPPYRGNSLLGEAFPVMEVRTTEHDNKAAQAEESLARGMAHAQNDFVGLPICYV